MPAEIFIATGNKDVPIAFFINIAQLLNYAIRRNLSLSKNVFPTPGLFLQIGKQFFPERRTLLQPFENIIIFIQKMVALPDTVLHFGRLLNKQGINLGYFIQTVFPGIYHLNRIAVTDQFFARPDSPLLKKAFLIHDMRELVPENKSQTVLAVQF